MIALFPNCHEFQRLGTWLLAAEQPAEARAIDKQIAIKRHPDQRSGSHEKFLKKQGYENHEAIELFLTQDERMLVNEIAPRTHNSGYFSLNSCETSQFS